MSKKNGSKKTKIWIAIGVLVVLGGMVGVILGSKQKPKGTEVDVAVVEADSIVQTVAASGKVQPAVDVNISANVSGRIVSLGAEEGDDVKRGDMLVQIEDEDYSAAVQQAEFSLRSAEASLEESQSTLNRIKQLHERDLAADADLEQAQATVKRLTAEVDRVQAALTEAKDRLAKTRIYAPIAGTVTRLNKEQGEMAIGATFSEDVIMVVSQLDAMEVNAEVNENDVVLVDVGDPVKIEVYAIPDTSFKGIVTEIGHSGLVQGQGTAEEVTNFEVKVTIMDQVARLRPGMSATVDIITERRDKAVVVPQEAVAVRSMKKEKKLEEKARSEENKKKGGKKKSNFDDDKGFEEEELSEVVYVINEDTAW
ncbi:efflux RND transporter periplasmic adaptor subunit, partial [bacterium]|nr:efflux RND transporter periplasmic adaptor subunit [bacterium]